MKENHITKGGTYENKSTAGSTPNMMETSIIRDSRQMPHFQINCERNNKEDDQTIQYILVNCAQ